MSIFEFANDNLFEPLKISNVYWFQDDSGLAFGGFGLYLTSREMAKLGQLYAQEGIWNGTRIISQDWVSQSTTNHLEPDVNLSILLGRQMAMVIFGGYSMVTILLQVFMGKE